VVSAYDEALAEALGDAEGDLSKRLLAGEADDNDRRAARESLDEATRRRFELAHPVPPRETAVEVELGEVEPGDVSEAIEKAAADNEGREVLVRVAVRVNPASDDSN
jgi:hypothetical protein